MLSDRNKTIYIIIVTYNGINWISKCLESTSPYPVIVVDNFSTDGTADYIEANYPKVSLLRQQKNLGFGKANNLGMSLALQRKAEFVFLLNQDAFLQKDTISFLVEKSLKYPKYGIISPVHLDVEGRGFEKIFQYYLQRKFEGKEISPILFNKSASEIIDIKMINAAAWLLPRKTLDIVGGFSPLFFLYGEDDNYCQRVRFHNLKIGICPGVYIRHDSGLSYHKDFRAGSKEFYNKYLNQVKVLGADVNEDGKKFKQLQKFQKQQVIKGFLKFQFRKVLIEFQKWRMIKNLDFTLEIEEERKKKRHYLNT